MVSIRGQKGFTIQELLVAGILIGIVFAGMATLYVTSFRFLYAQAQAANVNSAILTEHITRRVNLANEVVVVNLGQQLNVRLDAPASLAPRDPPTPTTSDDTWVMYGVFPSAMRWKITTDPNAIVTSGDPEVFSGVAVSDASKFTLVNPSNAGNPIVVNISLVLREGSPPKDINLVTDALAKARSK